VVDTADRHDFDVWYRTEHLPEAIKALKPQSAWRAWSRTDPSVHYAVYRFADVAAVEALNGSPALSGLIAEFDARWGSRVTRAREIIEVAD
jgi:hypothetical protein